MSQAPATMPFTQEELFPVENIIRTETVFTRYPIHQLGNGTTLPINIHTITDSGKHTLWSVSYNKEFGPPRQLAYQIDTLVINRCLDNATRPLPEIIKLANSLRDICRQLGRSEKDTEHVKRALFQNASAFIVAKQCFRLPTGGETDLTFGGTRYSIILSGDSLPTGTKSDGVYLVLHKAYREELDRIASRPLDYDYLRFLPASSQRLYELLSFHIFGAIHHGRACARYVYSDFCTFAPLVRSYSWDEVKKQLYKVHLPHLRSGYIDRIEHESFLNEEGLPDWALFYTPGKKAYLEYAAFTGERKRRPRGAREEQKVVPATAEQLALPGVDEGLIQELTSNELNRSDAERLTRSKPEECRRQLDFLPFVREFKVSRGAYLRRAIEEGYGPPKGYAEHAAREEARKRQADETARKEARQSHQKAHHGAFLAWVGERVGELEIAQPGVITTFKEAEEKTLQSYHRSLPKNSSALRAVLADFELPASRAERLQRFLEKHHPALKLPDFWEWDAAHNPERLSEEGARQG